MEGIAGAELLAHLCVRLFCFRLVQDVFFRFVCILSCSKGKSSKMIALEIKEYGKEPIALTSSFPSIYHLLFIKISWSVRVEDRVSETGS